MISLSQGHGCSTTLCNKILKRKGVWIFWKYHTGVPRVGSDSKQMWNLTQSVEGWWRTGVQQNTVGLSWSSLIMLLCSNFVVDIWLQLLCGIVLKEEGLTLVTHYFNPFSWVSLVPLSFSFYLMHSIVSILSSECVLHKRRMWATC
jgi:hypothetical protein